jgi:hypothetical protein
VTVVVLVALLICSCVILEALAVFTFFAFVEGYGCGGRVPHLRTAMIQSCQGCAFQRRQPASTASAAARLPGIEPGGGFTVPYAVTNHC